MKPTGLSARRIDEMQRAFRAEGVPHALATVVRTLDATSAKPGAKALIAADGTILEGWVGGGCARGAISRAGRTAIARNEPAMVALRPDDRLAAEGVEPCEARDGMIYERNGCASKGSMDIFVEPFVPSPELIVLGDGPVAGALRALARPFDFRVDERLPDGAARSEATARYIVVATQGRGDARTLEAAVSAGPDFLAFVGSRRKFRALRTKLIGNGADPQVLDAVVAPAGLDIGAATPEEIALSILSQIVARRRRGAP